MRNFAVQRHLSTQTAAAAVDSVARADASRKLAQEARTDAQAVNGMVSAIHAQRRAGQKVLPRREYPAVPAEIEDTSFFSGWRPTGESSFPDVVSMLKAKRASGQLNEQTYAQVVKVITDALRGDAKSMAALSKGFWAGTAGFPVSMSWYYICFTEACLLSGIKGFSSENELPEFLRSLAVAQWPSDAVEAFVAAGRQEILNRRRGHPLVRAGCWMMEQRNSGVAPVIYRTVLYEDQWALGYAGIGKGAATQVLERQLRQLEGSLNFGNMAFAQQLRQLMQFAFEGQWAYTPGAGRKFQLSIRLSNLGEAQFESQSDFEFTVLGWRQNENGGYTLHAQEKATGEWFLHHLPEHNSAPDEFLKKDVEGRRPKMGAAGKAVLFIMLAALGLGGFFLILKLWQFWIIMEQLSNALRGIQ